MEKFAVDLEKVLDEFEFNEEREEQVAHTSVKAQSLSHIGICQVPLGCTPAASYRRPSFEPINLAEADFAASPPSTSLSHYSNDLVNTHNFNRENLLILNNTLSNRSYINPSSSKNLQSVSNFVSIEEAATETNQEAFQPDKNWSANSGANPSVVEEKPDLLDYNSLSPNNVSVQVNHIPTQLPDITTSVWTLPDVQNRLSDTKDDHTTNAPLLDLINSSCGNLLHQISVQENVKERNTYEHNRDAENLIESQHSVLQQNKLQENIHTLPTDDVKTGSASYHIDYIEQKLKGSETEGNNTSSNTSVEDCVAPSEIPTYHVKSEVKQNEIDCKSEHSVSDFVQVGDTAFDSKTTNAAESGNIFSDTSHMWLDTGGQNKPCEDNNCKNTSVEVSCKEENLKIRNDFDKPVEQDHQKEDYENRDVNEFSENLKKEEQELDESKPSNHVTHKSVCLENEIAAVSDPKIDKYVKPVSFVCDNDVSENELEQFLEELIEEENSKIVVDKDHKNKTENESNNHDVNFNSIRENVPSIQPVEGKCSGTKTENMTSLEARSIESRDSSVNVNISISANSCLGNNSTYQEPIIQDTVCKLTTDNKAVDEASNAEKETDMIISETEESSLLTDHKENSSLTANIEPVSFTIKSERSEDQDVQTAVNNGQTTTDATGISSHFDVESQPTTDVTGLPKYVDVDSRTVTDTTDLPKYSEFDSRSTPHTTSGLPRYDDADSRTITDTTGLPKYDDINSHTTIDNTGLPRYDDVDNQTLTDTTGLPKYDDIIQESSSKCINRLSNSETKVINKSQTNMKYEENSYIKTTELKNTFSEIPEPCKSSGSSVKTLETSTESERSEIVHEDGKQLEVSCSKIYETETGESHFQTEINEHNSDIHKRSKGESEDCVLSGTEPSTGELCNDLDKVQNEGKKVCSSGVHTENINVMHLEQVKNKENYNENSSSKCLKVESSPSSDMHSSGPSEDNVLLTDGKVMDVTLDVSAKMIPVKSGVEIVSQTTVDEAGIPAEEEKPPRPSFLELANRITVNDEAINTTSPSTSGEVELSPEEQRLGKIPPFWVPDSEAPCCMQCQVRFHLLKRRHHCRSCGQVLCSKCCGLKARIEFLDFTEARVCQRCFTILDSSNSGEAYSSLGRQPNPNNPMEYCSTIPPLQQAAGSLRQPPPTVMVPVGVLKREGRSKSDVAKQVMFSDGIRPGGDLTELDGSGETRMPFRRQGRLTKRVGTPPGGPVGFNAKRALDPVTHSFIPAEGPTCLPPTVTRSQGELLYSDLEQPITLNQPTLKFAVNRNLYVLVKRVLLDCCVNQECWCISSEGLACVGQDEIVLLLECSPQENFPPKDAFVLVNTLYQDASKGSTVTEMSFTPAMSSNLLGSRDHGGFLYIRPTYQCTSQLILPQPPYLFALLIDRWETPWARLFPLRLVLRLGAEYRYYPCPLVSVRSRQPLYTDIGHTIINVLADFRKFSYTLPTVRGLMIHMEDRQTTILLPRNRYDQVVRTLNNSESVLAFGANLSLAADSHLVCMQTSEDENTSYHTQAINIHNKPRRVTGASFVVFNGALKTPGLAGKSSIVEDGLMVQVPSDTMKALHTALRDMRDFSIGCGPKAEETVLLQWTAEDTNFNIGVKSSIDGRPLDGIPCIRVHNGTDYTGGTKLIRWTEVFILQCEEGADHTGEPLDISRLSESLARATCVALVPHLELLSAASLTTLAVRATIHPENVGYEAGSNGEKLPPLYMKSLDDELVAVVDEAALAAQDTPATLELIFRVMEQG